MIQQNALNGLITRWPYSKNAWLLTLVFVLLVGIPMHLAWIPPFTLTAQGFITILVATLGDRRSGLLSGVVASSLVLSAAAADLGTVGAQYTPAYLLISVVWTLMMSFYLGWLRESLQEAVSALASRNDALAGSADIRTRELELVKDRLIASQTRLRTVTKRWVDSQEAERRNLARELHDDIGQSLTALRISLESNKRNFSNNVDAQNFIESSYHLVDDIISSVREVSLNLRPSLLDDLGLVAALRDLVMKQARKADIQCDFQVEGDDHFISPTHSIAAYRIAQEIVGQIVQRSQSSRADFETRIEPARLVMSVSSHEPLPENFLSATETSSIKERVALVGGTFDAVESEEGRILLTVTIPLHQTDEASHAA